MSCLLWTVAKYSNWQLASQKKSTGQGKLLVSVAQKADKYQEEYIVYVLEFDQVSWICLARKMCDSDSIMSELVNEEVGQFTIIFCIWSQYLDTLTPCINCTKI